MPYSRAASRQNNMLRPLILFSGLSHSWEVMPSLTRKHSPLQLFLLLLKALLARQSVAGLLLLNNRCVLRRLRLNSRSNRPQQLKLKPRRIEELICLMSTHHLVVNLALQILLKPLVEASKLTHRLLHNTMQKQLTNRTRVSLITV